MQSLLLTLFILRSNEIIRLTNSLHNYKVSILKKQVDTLINFLLGIYLTNCKSSLLKFLTHIWAFNFL